MSQQIIDSTNVLPFNPEGRVEDKLTVENGFYRITMGPRIDRLKKAIAVPGVKCLDEDLARMLTQIEPQGKVSASVISNWRQGQNNMSRKNYAKFCNLEKKYFPERITEKGSRYVSPVAESIPPLGLSGSQQVPYPAPKQVEIPFEDFSGQTKNELPPEILASIDQHLGQLVAGLSGLISFHVNQAMCVHVGTFEKFIQDEVRRQVTLQQPVIETKNEIKASTVRRSTLDQRVKRIASLITDKRVEAGYQGSRDDILTKALRSINGELLEQVMMPRENYGPDDFKVAHSHLNRLDKMYSINTIGISLEAESKLEALSNG
jgi:hypothetical protein